MTMRLRAVTATFTLLLAWPLACASANGSDPLKIPGAEPKPAAGAKAMHEAAAPSADPAATPAPAPSPPAAGASAPGATPAPAAAAPMSDAQKYCQNIAAAAADARFAWQSKKLAEVEAQIKQRVADLETRQAEVKDILTRYSDAVKRAKGGLVDIYAKMKPETAASQISAMEDSAAAAILSQLNAQKASAILNEIPPERAVKLVTTMSALVPPADGKKS